MSLKNRNASLLTAALSSVLVLAVSLSAQDRSHESQPSVATLPHQIQVTGAHKSASNTRFLQQRIAKSVTRRLPKTPLDQAQPENPTPSSHTTRSLIRSFFIRSRSLAVKLTL